VLKFDVSGRLINANLSRLGCMSLISTLYSLIANESSPTSLYSLTAFPSSYTLKLTCLFLILLALLASISKNLFFLSACSISGRYLSNSLSKMFYLRVSLSICGPSYIFLPSFLACAITLGAIKGVYYDARPNLIESEPKCKMKVSAPRSPRFRKESRLD